MAKNKTRSAIALEVERLYERANNDEQAVHQVHNYLIARFDTSRYAPKDKAAIDCLLQPYARELVHNCASGIWEELELVSKKLEKMILKV